MIGRKVRDAWYGLNAGEVIRWEPIGAAMTDVLVRDENGHECWYASHSLTPIDGLGPLPSRHEAQDRARSQTLASLKAIREQHVAEFHKPWPGCEHGKTIIGRAIDGAITALESEVKTQK